MRQPYIEIATVLSDFDYKNKYKNKSAISDHDFRK